MIESVYINWEVLGAQFARASDEVQGLFFKGLAKELKHWESNHQKQLQSASIATKLNDSEKAELEIFLEMLWPAEVR